jgi:peptidoglycan hydrolase-like protein with peptidoglycan-binding domain
MALALGTGLAATALAQRTTAPGPTTPPEQMQQPGSWVPAPAVSDTGSAASNPGNPNAASPNTAAPYGQTANLSPDTVKQAQQQPNSRGFYHGAIDGRIGPQMRAAVRQFQQKNGLPPKATLDRETLQRLKNAHRA